MSAAFINIHWMDANQSDYLMTQYCKEVAALKIQNTIKGGHIYLILTLLSFIATQSPKINKGLFNDQLSIIDYTLTSWQKGSYLHINRPIIEWIKSAISEKTASLPLITTSMRCILIHIIKINIILYLPLLPSCLPNPPILFFKSNIHIHV